MPKGREITQENFEQLLGWLHPCRDTAAAKYESIRLRLIKIFHARGCFAAEDLADETIDRVTRKAPELSESYTGDPSLFFYGVAKRVFLEFSRKPRLEELPPNIRPPEPTKEDEIEGEYSDCLERCLDKLDRGQHRLILDYYEGDKRVKIDRRKRLQAEMGISKEALRVRVLRIRSGLQKCVLNCVHNQVC